MKKLLAGIIAAFLLNACATSAVEDKATAIYLVRHAEKANDGTKNPDLSARGLKRAQHLAMLMKDIPLTHIHSTPYKRTLQTAQPTFDQSGLKEITAYAGNDLEDVAQFIKMTGGTHLVVGHSNTTPALTHILSDIPISNIETIHEDQYDYLYFVTINADEVASLEMLPYQPDFSDD